MNSKFHAEVTHRRFTKVSRAIHVGPEAFMNLFDIIHKFFIILQNQEPLIIYFFKKQLRVKSDILP